MSRLERTSWTLCLLVIAYCLGIASAWCQLIPPPPVRDGSSIDVCFTEKDRAKLNAIYRMSRAIHTKLFPLMEEQRLLNGGAGELQVQ